VAAGTEHLTLAEAAHRVGLSPRALRRAVNEGRLQGEQVGGRWLVRPEALDDYAERARFRRRDGDGRVADAGATVPAELMADLLHRYESALVRLGQLEAERERLHTSAAELDQVRAERDAAREEARSLRAALEARERNDVWTARPVLGEVPPAVEPAPERRTRWRRWRDGV
jgi:excisionase family DNA binding protein